MWLKVIGYKDVRRAYVIFDGAGDVSSFMEATIGESIVSSSQMQMGYFMNDPDSDYRAEFNTKTGALYIHVKNNGGDPIDFQIMAVGFNKT